MKTKQKNSSRLASRLLWLTAVVLIVPWLGIQSLTTMKSFLIEGQEQAQLLTARGVASLLSDRPELFADTPKSAEGFAELPLYPSQGPKLIDGYEDDWQSLKRFKQEFSQSGQTPPFSLIMSQADGVLYGLLNVEDQTPVTRHPGLLRMDQSDHVRFYLKGEAGENRRVLLTFEGNGSAIAYQMDKDWRYADPGSPDYRVRAQVVLGEGGYTIEFRMPLAWLGASRQMGVAVVDVADARNRDIVGITGTFPRLNEGSFNPVIVRSAAVEAVLQGFSQDNARLWILDDSRRVKAIVGNLQGNPNNQDNPQQQLYGDQNLPWWQLLLQRFTGWLVGANSGSFEDFDADTVHTRNDAIYQQALSGQPVTARRSSLDSKAEIVTAAYPITSDNQVIGVLLLEKSTRHILQLQRQSVETLVGLTVLGMLAVSLVLLVFAYRLTWRIRRLGRDAAANVDEFGRFVASKPIRGVKARDELGELARVVDKMLGGLSQHQAFLRNIPRTLRHEINNPLNTISTSLERLEQQPGAEPYTDSARRGLNRISHVVNSLAEAASLEQALQSQTKQPLDLAELLSLYVSHQSAQHSVPIALDVPSGKVMITGCGEHLEEMLDKLLDNARDFTQGEETPVSVGLRVSGDKAVLTVTNIGPLIPEEQFTELFHFMSSRRDGDEGHHFGLGLYVVRVIVEHHYGTVTVNNLPDGSGVTFTVELPLTPAEG